MKFCMHDVHPLRTFSSSFRVKTRRWGRERAEMRWPRSVVVGSGVGATPLQRRPISKERCAAFLDTHTNTTTALGTAKYTQGTRRSLAPSANHLLQSDTFITRFWTKQHLGRPQTTEILRLRADLTPVSPAGKCHFWPFLGHFGRFEASFIPA